MTAGSAVLDRPDVDDDEDLDEPDNLIHWYCIRCGVHPDGKHATAFCGKRVKTAPPRPPGTARPQIAGHSCPFCDYYRPHTCKDNK